MIYLSFYLARLSLSLHIMCNSYAMIVLINIHVMNDERSNLLEGYLYMCLYYGFNLCRKCTDYLAMIISTYICDSYAVYNIYDAHAMDVLYYIKYVLIPCTMYMVLMPWMHWPI